MQSRETGHCVWTHPHFGWPYRVNIVGALLLFTLSLLQDPGPLPKGGQLAITGLAAAMTVIAGLFRTVGYFETYIVAEMAEQYTAGFRDGQEAAYSDEDGAAA